MKLKEDFIQTTLLEILGEISTLDNCNSYRAWNEKRIAEKQEFCNKDSGILLELVDLVFTTQSIFINEATTKGIDTIYLHKLGRFTKSPAREEIMNTYRENPEEFTQEDARRIIDKHIERVIAYKNNKNYLYDLNIKTNEEIERDTNTERESDLF
jgi:hypothetical protein